MFNKIDDMNENILSAAKKHAEDQYPKESCGFIVDNHYIKLRNISKTPENSFRISRKKIAEYEGRIQAVIHSHPDGPNYPSRADMQAQVAMDVAWGIVPVYHGQAKAPFFWGGETPVPELLGRPFRHGITDCYSLIRDYFRCEKNITLDEFPREWEWWKAPGFNLYEENFKSQDFRIIDAAEVQVGDCFLAQVHANVINHAGIYVGNGQILHQLGTSNGYSPERPSCRHPLHMWKKFIRHWVQHQSVMG